jgi:hypothetical protein
MSRELFEHWLSKEALQVVKSDYVFRNDTIVAAGTPDADCVTLFKKP